jgi:hypothetical protein
MRWLLAIVGLAVAVSAAHARDEASGRVPFAVGEKLTFDVRYGFLKAGEATMEVTGIVDCDGSKCYRVVSAARSTAPFSLVFEVKDSVTSLMDTRQLCTRRYHKNLREGNYSKNELIVFDQENHVAVYPDGSELPVPENVQDVLTSLYYLRTRKLEVGDSVLIDNHADKKNYPLEVRVLRTETISVPAGRFDCFVVEPILKASGLFQHQGRLTVWLTRDSRMIPVKMSGKIVVGSIEAVLARLSPGLAMEDSHE